MQCADERCWDRLSIDDALSPLFHQLNKFTKKNCLKKIRLFVCEFAEFLAKANKSIPSKFWLIANNK